MSQKNLVANAVGTRDLVGQDVAIRQKVISIASGCFQTMDAIEFDTPIIELKSVVNQLYGEEFDKQVYELVNYKEELSENENNIFSKQILRYDMTVPLARYCAMNNKKVLRRYQIGKVYRRDKPNLQNGRYREFYQCDFDIVGDDMGSGINDIEILELLVRILDKTIGKNTFSIKINHRKFLTDVLYKCGLEDPNKLAPICSAIDKLGKYTWAEIYQEFEQKGVNKNVAINFQNFIELVNSTKDFLDKLSIIAQYTDKETIISFTRLVKMIYDLGILPIFEFDISLSRGMDYYTGIIYEAVYLDKNIMPSSIAAGGRYDKMIGKLGSQGEIPAIGLSIGVERIVKILEATEEKNTLENKPKVFLASIGCKDDDVTNMIITKEKIKICSELRKNGINVSMSNKSNPKMGTQFQEVLGRGIKYMVVIGQQEISESKIRIKNIEKKEEMIFGRDEGIQFLLTNI